MVGRSRSAAWLVLSALLICGCGSDAPPAAETAPAAGDGKVTLYVEGMADRLGLY
jgi:hypothetical protein